MMWVSGAKINNEDLLKLLRTYYYYFTRGSLKSYSMDVLLQLGDKTYI